MSTGRILVLTRFTCIWFNNISGITTDDDGKKRNKTTEFTDENQNTSLSSMTKKTVENKHRTSVLLDVAGTFISTLLLLVIGFQLRSGIILCHWEHNDQQNMFCENEKAYAEATYVQGSKTKTYEVSYYFLLITRVHIRK